MRPERRKSKSKTPSTPPPRAPSENIRAREPSTTALIESKLLNGPEPVLGLYLHVAYIAFMSTYEEGIGRGEITPNVIGVLSLLSQRPGMSQSELARLFRLERATMGVTVARAVAAGFVRRTGFRGDARRYSLYLTARGEQMLVTLRERISEHEKHAAGLLTLTERLRLRELLDKLVYG